MTIKSLFDLILLVPGNGDKRWLSLSPGIGSGAVGAEVEAETGLRRAEAGESKIGSPSETRKIRNRRYFVRYEIADDYTNFNLTIEK